MVEIFKVRELRDERLHKFCGINLPLEHNECNQQIALTLYAAPSK